MAKAWCDCEIVINIERPSSEQCQPWLTMLSPMTDHVFNHGSTCYLIIIIIIILSFDIAPFPYKHAQRRITFHCQRIDIDIHIVN